MLKIRYPRFVASTLVAGVLLAATPFAHAAEEVMGYVKISAPKKVAGELQQTMQTIMPGMQGQMMMSMFLSPYGFPTFPGVSEEEPVTIVISADLENPMMQPRVIGVAKMTTDSLTRQSLAQRGLQFVEAGEWTLISPDPAMLLEIPNQDAILQTAAVAATHDVEARMLLGPEKAAKAADMIQGMLMMQMADADPDKTKNIQGLITLLKHELGNFAWASQAIDLDAGNLVISMNGKAIEGTPLAELFSMQGGVDVAIAKYISVDEPLVMITGTPNVDVPVRWIETLIANAKPLFTEDVAKGIDAYAGLIDMLKGKYTGDAAYSMSFENIEKPVFTVISESSLSAAETAEMVSITTAFTNSMFELAAGMAPEEANIAMSVTAEIDFDEHSGAAIHKMTQVFQMPSPYAGLPDEVLRNIIVEEAGGALSDAAIKQKMEEYRKGEVDETVTYTASANGNIIQSQDLDKLKSTIDLVLNEEAAANNVYDVLTLGENEIIKGQLDVEALMLQLLKNPEMAMGMPLSPAQIKALNLEPVSMSFETNAGEANGKMAIPLSIIGTIAQESMKAQQQQQMQP